MTRCASSSLVRLIALVILIVLGFAPARVAWAHASLISSEPAEGAVLATPPQRVILMFNEPISPLRLQLIHPTGEVTPLSDLVQHNMSIIARLSGPLGEGTHVLSWRVVSTDGHPVGGTLVFSVGRRDAAPPAVETRSALSVRLAIWSARVAIFLALFFGVGGTVFTTWIAAARPLPGNTEKPMSALLLGGLAVLPLSVGLQGLDALGVPLSSLKEGAIWLAGFSTSYGTTAIIAMLALAAALFSMRARDPAVARLQSLAALFGVGFALATSGHAAVAAPQLLMRPAVFLHVTAVAFWIGCLWPLAATLGDSGTAGQQALRRFSRTIPWIVAVLLVSGGALAVVQLARIDALWTTSYGWVFLAKIGAVLVMLGLAAVNRFMLAPPIDAGNTAAARRQLRQSIAVELGIALAILGIAALWRFTPPPRSIIAVETASEFIHFHDGRAMADLTLEPGRVGRSSGEIVIRDGQYQPMMPKGVTLMFFQPATGIEPLRREAVDVGDYTWRVENIVIPTPGRWRLRIEILLNDFEKLTLEDDIQIRP